MTQLPTNKELARTVETVSALKGMSIRRHRRWIAVNALIEVLHIGTQRGLIPAFIVKGGFALEFRFRTEARASRDVDVVVALTADDILDAFVQVLRIRLERIHLRDQRDARTARTFISHGTERAVQRARVVDV